MSDSEELDLQIRAGAGVAFGRPLKVYSKRSRAKAAKTLHLMTPKAKAAEKAPTSSGPSSAVKDTQKPASASKLPDRSKIDTPTFGDSTMFTSNILTSPLATISSRMLWPKRAKEESPDPQFKATRIPLAEASPKALDEDPFDLPDSQQPTSPAGAADTALPATEIAAAVSTGAASDIQAAATDDDEASKDNEEEEILSGQLFCESSNEYNGDDSIRAQKRLELDDEGADEDMALDEDSSSDVRFAFRKIVSHRAMPNDPNRFELEVSWEPDILVPNNNTWVAEEEIMHDAPDAYFRYWDSVHGRDTHVADPDMWYMFNIRRERSSGRGKAYLIEWLGSRELSWEPESNVRKVAANLLKEWKAKQSTKGKTTTKRPPKKGVTRRVEPKPARGRKTR